MRVWVQQFIESPSGAEAHGCSGMCVFRFQMSVYNIAALGA